jgi:hypothetical protein
MQMPTLPPGADHGLTPLFAWTVSPIYWLHLPLLIVLVSLVYSGTRFDDWKHILRDAVRCGLRLAAFLAVIMVVLFVLATYMYAF